MLLLNFESSMGKLMILYEIYNVLKHVFQVKDIKKSNKEG